MSPFWEKGSRESLPLGPRHGGREGGLFRTQETQLEPVSLNAPGFGFFGKGFQTSTPDGQFPTKELGPKLEPRVRALRFEDPPLLAKAPKRALPKVEP